MAKSPLFSSSFMLLPFINLPQPLRQKHSSAIPPPHPQPHHHVRSSLPLQFFPPPPDVPASCRTSSFEWVIVSTDLQLRLLIRRFPLDWLRGLYCGRPPDPALDLVLVSRPLASASTVEPCRPMHQHSPFSRHLGRRSIRLCSVFVRHSRSPARPGFAAPIFPTFTGGGGYLGLIGKPVRFPSTRNTVAGFSLIGRLSAFDRTALCVPTAALGFPLICSVNSTVFARTGIGTDLQPDSLYSGCRCFQFDSAVAILRRGPARLGLTAPYNLIFRGGSLGCVESRLELNHILLHSLFSLCSTHHDTGEAAEKVFDRRGSKRVLASWAALLSYNWSNLLLHDLLVIFIEWLEDRDRFFANDSVHRFKLKHHFSKPPLWFSTTSPCHLPSRVGIAIQQSHRSIGQSCSHIHRSFIGLDSGLPVSSPCKILLSEKLGFPSVPPTSASPFWMFLRQRCIGILALGHDYQRRTLNCPTFSLWSYLIVPLSKCRFVLLAVPPLTFLPPLVIRVSHLSHVCRADNLFADVIKLVFQESRVIYHSFATSLTYLASMGTTRSLMSFFYPYVCISVLVLDLLMICAIRHLSLGWECGYTQFSQLTCMPARIVRATCLALVLKSCMRLFVEF